MNCIIIEDEPAAQSVLEHHISLSSGLEWKGTFSDAFAAQAWLDNNKADLIFLDINLPEMSGVSFLRTLVHPPMVIFTTAYPQYAIEGFDLEIIDFLLKPFSFERFSKAVNKAKERFNTAGFIATPAKITVKSDRRIYQLEIANILYVEAVGDYVSVHSADKKLLVHGTLKSWEEKLGGYSFFKAHRTTLVNLEKIDHVEGNYLQIGAHRLPLSESYRQSLIEKMFSQDKK